MDPLYQEHIIDHYKHPHNRRFMEDADVKQKGFNASCGDDLILYLKWENAETLADISFEGFGCVISQSGASMLTDKVKGMTKAEMTKLTPEDMYELYGIEITHERDKCAMLALSTLKDALVFPDE